MDRSKYIEAENYWKNHDKKSIKMERNVILDFADNYLSEHNTGALATGYDDFVRCTPIEYSWIKGSFYMLSEGGMKFKTLAENKNVCITVFEPYQGFGNITSIVVSGKAEVIESGTEEYRMVLAFKGIQESAIQKLSHPMYLIKLVPKTMELLFSEFKKSGFDSRQQITF